MTSLLAYISGLIVSLNGFGVFIASIIEEVIVPIPSTLIQSGAGMLLLSGQPLSIFSVSKLIVLVALPAACGVAIGSLVIYGISYWGGIYALKKYGAYFFINYEKLEKARCALATKPRLLIVLTILRFVPLFPNALLTAAAGLMRVRLGPYIISTFIGIFIRALYLGAIGWAAGSATSEVAGFDSLLAKLGTLILILVTLSILTGVLVSYAKNRRKTI